MTLAPGVRLGEYEILGLLGAGGMGQVWRARDTKLGRDVALKLLPEAFAEDPERLSRFRREAHLLASLNHPNIAAIHGLEEADGKPFLALELVEGEDLALRLTRGPIPRDEALEIAMQIAEALEEAHGKGIVHRDLKPGNVMITPGGRVKVLDFGLAKAYGGDDASGTASADVSQSPTLTRSGTLAGVILGTAAYMSPEQASGKAVDRRADIWSFGVVLFEMLTGRRPFTGETPSVMLAAVIKEEPSWTALPRDCPAAIVRLLRRCLRKLPRERLQDVGDARLEISDVLQGASEGPAAATPGLDAVPEIERRRLRERWAWAAAALLGALALLIGLRRFTEAPEARSAVRFALDPPEGMSLDAPFFNGPAVSPDGRSVAFAAAPPTAWLPTLWIRSLGSGEPRLLAGTEGAMMPFWSPDGASVAFFTVDGLKRISLSGETVERICALPLPALMTGGAWNGSGTILFSGGGPNGRIYSVAAAGGEAKPVTALDESRKETGHSWPQFLPDGRRFLFGVGSAQPENAGLYVASLDSPDERRRVLPVPARVVYAAAGYLLFVRDKALLAQPFDAGRLEVRGDATSIGQSVASWQSNPSWGWFSVSASGSLAYLAEGTESGTELVWLDRKGEKVGTVGQPAQYGQIALSPDGRRVAVEIASANGPDDLWVVDVSRGVASRITADPAGERDPVWSPDGREMVFGSDSNGVNDLFRKSLRVNGPESPLLRSSADKVPESWTPDGKTLLYVTAAGGSAPSVWALSPGAGAEPELLLQNGFAIDEPQVSPDGRWLAYTSDESGRWEVYVQAFRRTGERVRVSADGGGQPKWRGDGRELFYLARDGRVMAVGIKGGGPAPDVGLPAALFAIGSFRPGYDDYAPAADGQRFLVKVPVEKRPRRIQVVLDWPSLLRPSP